MSNMEFIQKFFLQLNLCPGVLVTWCPGVLVTWCHGVPKEI